MPMAPPPSSMCQPTAPSDAANEDGVLGEHGGDGGVRGGVGKCLPICDPVEERILAHRLRVLLLNRFVSGTPGWVVSNILKRSVLAPIVPAPEVAQKSQRRISFLVTIGGCIGPWRAAGSTVVVTELLWIICCPAQSCGRRALLSAVSSVRRCSSGGRAVRRGRPWRSSCTWRNWRCGLWAAPVEETGNQKDQYPDPQALLPTSVRGMLVFLGNNVSVVLRRQKSSMTMLTTVRKGSDTRPHTDTHHPARSPTCKPKLCKYHE